MMLLAELGRSDWLVTSVIGGEGDFLLLGLGCLETGTLYQIETDIYVGQLSLHAAKTMHGPCDTCALCTR